MAAGVKIWRALWLALLLGAAPAGAEDNALLIQMLAGGRYQVWHTEGATNPSDDELLVLDANASAEGRPTVATAAGPAYAVKTANGVVAHFPAAPRDRQLLLDRDGCGHIKAWHGEGATQLSEEQITELVLAALPGGGPRLIIGERLAKSFLVPLGVAVTLWRPLRRP